MGNRLSEMVTEARRFKDLTMREFAAKIGCKVSELSDLEHGRGGIEGVPPLHHILHKIVTVLGLDAASVFEAQGQWKPEKEPEIQIPKKREEKTWNIFTCLTCEEKPEFDSSGFADHCKNTHGIDKPEGIRTMVMHLDGQDFFQWEWEWDIGKGAMKVHQSTRDIRSKNDPMRFGH